MRFSERLYGGLLRIYPRSFLVEYRGPLQQAFRDQLRDAKTARSSMSLWTRTFADLVPSAVCAHWQEGGAGSRMGAAAAYLLALVAAALLGRFELGTDDAGVVVGFILLGTFVLGCLHPRRVWLWACLGLCVPAADHLGGARQLPPESALGSLMVVCLVLLVGAVGSWFGFLVRKAALTN